MLPGNIENFIGVAQVPIGLAGPLLINGEHAHGEFYVPLATTEGTLVASYSRGMRLLTEAGGVRTTVIDDFMQRSPVFYLDNSLQARNFGDWVNEHFEAIKAAAETTTSVGRLDHIGQYSIGPLRFLRFNYTTGDAAWSEHVRARQPSPPASGSRPTTPDHPEYILSGNIDTDKKHSADQHAAHPRQAGRGRSDHPQPTAARPDGRRRPDRPAHPPSVDGRRLPGRIVDQRAHAANGLTAMFIACGQDVANIAESHAGVGYLQLTPNGDLYWSDSRSPPSSWPPTEGGTGLPTQRQCLELLGCYGTGTVRKFAEICAATVLAGETSLTSAVLAGDWVSSHDQLGRNRP